MRIQEMEKELQNDKISSIIPFSSTFEGSMIFFEAP